MKTFEIRDVSDRQDQDVDRDFVVELTIEELASVGGGASDAEANSEKIKR